MMSRLSAATACLIAATLAVAAAPAWADQFQGSPLPPGQTSDPRDYDITTVTITQNASSAIVAGASVSCNNGAPNYSHTDNSYYRRFNLDGAHGIVTPFSISRVDFGIEQARGLGGTTPVTLRLHTIPNAAPLTLANLTQIASLSLAVADQALTILQVPIAASVTDPLSVDLVVEVFTPNGQADNNSFFIGSNSAGQTAPTYLRAPDCGVTEPATTGSLGFPNMHTYMAVTGDAEPPPVQSVCTVRTDADQDCSQDLLNAQVSVEGVITAWKHFGGRGPGAISDPVNGCCISVFDIDTEADLPIGTLVRITGWTGPFFGLDELVDEPTTGTPNPTVTVLSGGHPTPATKVTCADLANNSSTAEDLESCLVELCARFISQGTFSGNTNYDVVDADNQTCQVRIDADTDIVGTPIPAGDVVIRGILGQFDRTGAGGTVRVPCTGYQLLPRLLTDMVPFGNCATIGVQERTWSGLKSLYR